MTIAKDEYYRTSSAKTKRLIQWNVDVLMKSLKEIVARRNTRKGLRASFLQFDEKSALFSGKGTTALDEVCEIIALPEFDSESAKRQEDNNSIELPVEVVSQLTEYVKSIAMLYENNVSYALATEFDIVNMLDTSLILTALAIRKFHSPSTTLSTHHMLRYVSALNSYAFPRVSAFVFTTACFSPFSSWFRIGTDVSNEAFVENCGAQIGPNCWGQVFGLDAS